MIIERNDDRIIIRYIDDNFNSYRCMITDTDIFVVNFCKKNLDKMEKIIKNGILEESDNNYILKVEEPVYLEYVLKKEVQEDTVALGYILEKFRKVEEENKFYKEKIILFEKQLNKLIEKTDKNTEIINKIETTYESSVVPAIKQEALKIDRLAKYMLNFKQVIKDLKDEILELKK